MSTRTALNPRINPDNHARPELPPGEQIIEEMQAHALAYFTEHGADSPIGHWLWNLAGRLQPELCPVPENVIQFPMQRRKGNT